MRLKIKSNPGSNDFPSLKPLPVIGDVREFPEPDATRLLKMGLADVVEELKAVRPTPFIAEAKPAELKAVPPAAKPKAKGET